MQARRGRRMHAVRNVAIDLLKEENPELLTAVLTDALNEWRLHVAYLLPGRTITEAGYGPLTRLHLIASGTFLRS